MNQIKRDIITAIVMFMIWVVFYLQTLGIPQEAKSYPLGVLYLTLVLLVVYFVSSIIQLKKQCNTTNEELGKIPSIVILMGILTLIYIVLINIVGYVVSSILFILAALKLCNETSIKMYVGVALGLTASIYLIFTYVLSVMLPSGFLI
ncbi:hypothetical protein AN639_00310 [Candidatus Epulonipiscium fishelsonii]|uniref:Uncharacterized protein n=1 Tax=Candidatus Epulonipiscium fishelsonii TaxID=77094 RepID=A0ACC8XCU4_9FIRM|nr:hypothetical protein AN396_05465 [Epulopiscium sp. SCG-B11WGA-EpuloA1]ONI41828.1 hypothetical protein AN639_00310 [Epulopiscium sp. SCG-B05WGA-EpuloA1]